MTKTKTRVQPRTFREFAAGLPKKYLECRADGHHFRHFTAKHYRKEHYIERRLKCSCGTLKNQLLDEAGFILRAGRYSYPEGFLAKGVEMPASRAEVNAICRLTLTQKDMGLIA